MKNYELKSLLPLEFAYLPEWEIARAANFVEDGSEKITFSLVELVCRSQEQVAGEITIITQEESSNVTPVSLVNNFVGNLKNRKMQVNGSILLPIEPPTGFLKAWQFCTEAKSDDCLFGIIAIVLKTESVFVLMGLTSAAEAESKQWWQYNYQSFLLILNSLKCLPVTD